MAYYLLQLAYTPEGWAAQLQNPQDRVEAVRPVIEGLGGERRERLSGVRRVRRGAPVPVSRQPARGGLLDSRLVVGRDQSLQDHTADDDR